MKEKREPLFSNGEATRAWLDVYAQLGITMKRERITKARELDALDLKVEKNHRQVSMLQQDLEFYERTSTAGAN